MAEGSACHTDNQAAKLLEHLRESLETAQHSLQHARDGAKDNADVITARGFLSMALDAIYAEEKSDG